MEHLDVIRMGLILAIQAEIEGMKAHNTYCMYTAEYIAYDEGQFAAKAEEIRDICYRPNERL